MTGEEWMNSGCVCETDLTTFVDGLYSHVGIKGKGE